MRPRLVVPILVLAASVSNDFASGQTRERAATPQQPSFSFNASTTYPRSLELETAFSVDDNLLDTPSLLKYGFSGDLEGFFGISPISRRHTNGGSDTEAFNGATVGMKYRLQDSGVDVPALAVLVASTEFDDFTFIGIYSQEFPRYTLDVNFGLTFDGGTTVTGVATFSRALDQQVGIFGEALLQNNFDVGKPKLLLGVGGALSRNPLYVWDAAVDLGVVNAAFDVRLQIGLTANLEVVQQ